jgi:hypothetical protein
VQRASSDCALRATSISVNPGNAGRYVERQCSTSRVLEVDLDGATHAATNTNAKLANDIMCNPTNGDVGVTLNSGADLDMNGKTITCAGGQTCVAG